MKVRKFSKKEMRQVLEFVRVDKALFSTFDILYDHEYWMTAGVIRHKLGLPKSPFKSKLLTTSLLNLYNDIGNLVNNQKKGNAPYKFSLNSTYFEAKLADAKLAADADAVENENNLHFVANPEDVDNTQNRAEVIDVTVYTKRSLALEGAKKEMEDMDDDESLIVYMAVPVARIAIKPKVDVENL